MCFLFVVVDVDSVLAVDDEGTFLMVEAVPVVNVVADTVAVS